MKYPNCNLVNPEATPNCEFTHEPQSDGVKRAPLQSNIKLPSYSSWVFGLLCLVLSSLTFLFVFPFEFASAEIIGYSSDVYWGYSCAEGPPPAEWFLNCEECGGTEQSPININTSSLKRGSIYRLKMKYRKADLDVENNGHTITAHVSGKGSVFANGKKYELLQFHWHTPSEHWKNGEKYRMEMHLVHQSVEDQSLLVIGVHVKVGKKNSTIDLEDIFDNLPLTSDSPNYSVSDFDLRGILPDKKILRAYSYEGSLTTPGCTEGVRWVVLKNTIRMSKEQITNFEELFFELPHFPNGNARPIQSLNGRKVLRSVITVK